MPSMSQFETATLFARPTGTSWSLLMRGKARRSRPHGPSIAGPPIVRLARPTATRFARVLGARRRRRACWWHVRAAGRRPGARGARHESAEMRSRPSALHALPERLQARVVLRGLLLEGLVRLPRPGVDLGVAQPLGHRLGERRRALRVLRAGDEQRGDGDLVQAVE